MIDLVVDDYCHNCMHFEADVDIMVIRANNFSVDGDKNIVDTTIRCARRDACHEIEEFFKKKGSFL